MRGGHCLLMCTALWDNPLLSTVCLGGGKREELISWLHLHQSKVGPRVALVGTPSRESQSLPPQHQWGSPLAQH